MQDILKMGICRAEPAARYKNDITENQQVRINDFIKVKTGMYLHKT